MKINKLMCIAALVTIVWACPAAAAEGTAEKRSDTLLETVKVTAQKREENVQEVPAAVSVLSDVAIEDASIESTLDVMNHIPNMFTANGGSRGYFSRIAIRGISNTGMGDPGVALYIDDVPYSDLYIFNSPLFDLERIEVLKGPQGTLYGKNTEGGAINVVTRKPGNTPEAKIGAEVGTLGRYQILGNVNVPLIENELFFRMSALGGGRDGYVHNVTLDKSVDKESTKSIRSGLVYKPTDRLDANLNLSITTLNDAGFPMVAKDRARYEASTGLTGLDDFETGNDHEGESDSRDMLSSLRLRYEADALNKNELTLDGDFTPTPLYIGFNTNDATAFSQEIRLMSKASQTDFKWLVGGFFADETKEATTGYILDTVAAAMMRVPVGSRDEMAADLKARDVAVFGQATVRFFGEALGVTGGLRYDVAQRSMDRTHTFNGAAVNPKIEKDKTFTDILPKVAVDYRITDSVMAYGSYAQGYKAGGFSYAVDDVNLVQYDPEKSNAFEVGLKSEFPELGLRVNLAAFYTMVDDFQDRVQVTPTTIIQANAATMTSRGFEVESVYDFTQSWSLLANFGYTDATYGDYPDALAGTNYKDKKVSLIPEHDLGVALQYRSAPGFMGRFEVRNVGKTYLNRANTAVQTSYFLANLKAGYETESWEVYLTAENLTNKQYFLEALEDRTVGFVGTVGAPRNFRLSGAIRF